MPAEMALPALRLLATHRTEEARRSMLTALRPGILARTLLNAYVLPSLSELGLYAGTLRSGDVTRYGRAIAEANAVKARALMARKLLELDASRVGLLDWLAQLSPRGERKRFALRRFLDERLGLPESSVASALDRLGKWAGYLIEFDIIRERDTGRGLVWDVSRRHLAALSTAGEDKPSERLPDDVGQATALLSAYSQSCEQLGTRLYLPISAVREELGAELKRTSGTLLDEELDDILRRSPTLLKDHLVSFSPFSGPARGGLKLENMYAGFISIRKRPTKAESSN